MQQELNLKEKERKEKKELSVKMNDWILKNQPSLKYNLQNKSKFN